MPIEYKFICCKKNPQKTHISSCKIGDLFSSVFKKILQRQCGKKYIHIKKANGCPLLVIQYIYIKLHCESNLPPKVWKSSSFWFGSCCPCCLFALVPLCRMCLIPLVIVVAPSSSARLT